MGLNTAAIILNDDCSRLLSTGAGEQIYRAVVSGGRADCQPPFGVTVLPPVHADTVQIVAVGGNRIFALGYGRWTDEPEQLLKRLAEQMGYRVSKKPLRRDALQPDSEPTDAAKPSHPDST